VESSQARRVRIVRNREKKSNKEDKLPASKGERGCSLGSRQWEVEQKTVCLLNMIYVKRMELAEMKDV
jgi:hypothetical protein